MNGALPITILRHTSCRRSKAATASPRFAGCSVLARFWLGRGCSLCGKRALGGLAHPFRPHYFRGCPTLVAPGFGAAGWGCSLICPTHCGRHATPRLPRVNFPDAHAPHGATVLTCASPKDARIQPSARECQERPHRSLIQSRQGRRELTMTHPRVRRWKRRPLGRRNRLGKK